MDSSTARIGSGVPPENSQSRLMQVMRRSRGSFSFGTRLKELGGEFRSAPGAGFERDGGVLLILFEFAGTGAGGILIFVSGLAYPVGRGGLPHPKPDFEGPLSQLFDIFDALQFHGADEGGATAQLIE